MDQILLDKQPGLATSAIVGTLTLAKTGTTARTATFPDAAITVAGLQVANVFTAAQTVPDGSAAAPGLRLTSEASGLYRVSSTVLGVSVAGVGTLQIGAPTTGIGAGFRSLTTADADYCYFISDRTNAELRISPGSSTTNGANLQLFGSTHATASTGRLRASTTSILEWTATGITTTQAITVPNGTAAAPGIRLTSEAHGLYRFNSTNLGFAVAGAYQALLSSTGLFAATTIQGSDGSAAAPSLRTTTEAHGLYRFNSTTLGFAVAGTASAILTSSGAFSATNLSSTSTAITSIQTSGGMTFASIAAATTDGGLQRESNQEKLYAYANGIGGWMDKCLFSQYATVSQAGIVTDQSLASATARGTRTLPANFFKQGKVLKFRLCGRYTTDAAAGNATVQIKLGSTVFRTTGSFALDNSSTALPWTIEGEIVCQSTGVTGTVEGVSVWEHMITGATGNWNAENLGGTAAVTIDTTASQAFDVIWTATDAGTTITCTCFRLWEVC